MAICSDASNKYLRDVGYNVVRVPRKFLPPLTLIGRQNNTIEVLGELTDLITQPSGPLPPILSDQTASSINGQKSSSMKLSLGLSILGGLISGLGGGKLGASAGFTNARTTTFEFNNVVVDSVAPLKVGAYLRDGDVDEGNLILAQYVTGNGQLYVVTERLRSNEITVVFEGNHGVTANVDVPVISNMVGGSLGVELANGRKNAVKFKGAELLTFGFKCFQIGVKDGNLSMFATAPGGVFLSLADETEEPSAGASLLGDGLLDLGDRGPGEAAAPPKALEPA